MTAESYPKEDQSIDRMGRLLASLAFYTRAGEAMLSAILDIGDRFPSPWRAQIKQVLSARDGDGNIIPTKLQGLLIEDYTADVSDMDPMSILLAARAAVKAYDEARLEANAKIIMHDPSKTIAEKITLIQEMAAGGGAPGEPPKDPGLPKIEAASDLCAQEIIEPPQVIKGVLHRGSKLVFGGPSKSFKSWNLIDLCLAVATGGGWLEWPTLDESGLALYINLELQPFAIQRRIKTLCDARNIQVPKNLHVWNLRGTGTSLERLLAYLPDTPYDLIVPDPIYKLYGVGKDENKASDIALLCSELEEMTAINGAAVAVGAHFAKGLASAKEHLDRVSGSGVFARDPDTFITVTPHEQELCYTVEATARNFPPIDPFVARWSFPQMHREMGADPAKLRKPGGRPAEHEEADLLKYLKPGMKTSAWQKACDQEGGISKATFYRTVKLIEGKSAERPGGNWQLKK